MTQPCVGAGWSPSTCRRGASSRCDYRSRRRCPSWRPPRFGQCRPRSVLPGRCPGRAKRVGCSGHRRDGSTRSRASAGGNRHDQLHAPRRVLRDRVSHDHRGCRARSARQPEEALWRSCPPGTVRLGRPAVGSCSRLEHLLGRPLAIIGEIIPTTTTARRSNRGMDSIVVGRQTPLGGCALAGRQ